MQLIDLNLADEQQVEFFKSVYHDSFPLEERRDIENILYHLEHTSEYHLKIAQVNHRNIGFLVYWELEHITFGEYLAIDTKQRNGGYGRKIIDWFKKEAKHPILLEVELPHDSFSKRRIEFYKRLEFKLWEDIAYNQPAYHKETSPVPMHIMTFGDIDLHKHFDQVKNEMFNLVYKF